ncbi:aromatic ring-hydroxylating dioxygenase subunit alpha [Kribbella sp. NPDC051620]|uniref:aromatic ring-hydroxylating dioxygenase subunit alpha n=1 Tax=Kribbella sp. NPDC051620 TaxID=3364120 RepID=UPI0037906F94
MVNRTNTDEGRVAMSEYHDNCDLDGHFDRHWIAVARTSELVGKGVFVTFNVGADPIVVIRNGTGELKAHLNVCRHRGSQILEGTGLVKSIMCPYHGWMYSLDGELRGAPEMKYTERFDKSEFPLISFQATEWAGFAMVAIDPADPVPSNGGLDPALVDELAVSSSAARWMSTAGGRWYEVLAEIAERTSSRWTMSSDGDGLVGDPVDTGGRSPRLLRPNLLLVPHAEAWIALTALPGPGADTMLIGNCLVQEGLATEAAASLVALSKAITTPNPAARGGTELSEQLRSWVTTDRKATLSS